MKLFLLLSILIISIGANAQGMLKPIPKPQLSYRVTAPVFDSSGNIVPPPTNAATLNAFRFLGSIAAYGEPGSVAMAGLGYGYQHLVFDPAANKYICQWSINAVAWAGGSVAPSTPSSIISVGPMIGIENNLIMVGAAYNPGLQNGSKIMATISIGISFNN